LLFIDGSSFIDAFDPSWEIYFLFEKRIENEKMAYRIAGYSTVFNFFAYPDQIRKRISQMLIFPPYQHQGHGSNLLNAIYSAARSESSVKDINVEDPSIELSRMRDFVDCANLINNGYLRDLKALDSKMINDIRAALKLNKEQIKHCHEIFQFMNTKLADEEQYKQFRLSVKRRLMKKYQDPLSAFESKDEKKKELDKYYREVEEEYKSIVGKLRSLNQI